MTQRTRLFIVFACLALMVAATFISSITAAVIMLFYTGGIFCVGLALGAMLHERGVIK